MTKTGQQISDTFTDKDIRKRMIDLDLSIAEVARRIKKSRSAVSFAVNHPAVVPAVRKSVLKLLGLV